MKDFLVLEARCTEGNELARERVPIRIVPCRKDKPGSGAGRAADDKRAIQNKTTR